MADGELIFDTEVDTDNFEKGVKSIKEKLKNINNSVDSISRSTKKAFDGMSSAQIGLVNNLDQTKKKISELRSKIKEIEETKIPTEQYKKMHDKVAALKKEYSDLIEKKKEWESLGVSSKNSTAMQELESNIKNVKAEMQNVINSSTKLEKSGQAYKYQGATPESITLKENLNTEEGKFIKLNKQLDELNAKEDKASKTGTKLKSILSGIGGLTKAFSSKITSAFKKADNSAKAFAKKLTSIGIMLKARVIGSLISGIIKGVKIGFNNLVQYSESVNSSISGLKSSFTQLNNALATAFMPILQKLAPIVQSIINKIIEAINVVAQFTSRLFSNSNTFTRAKKINEDYAKSLNKTSKEQKKSFSFDTIEKIDSKNDNGSVDPSEMFETANIEKEMLNFTDSIKKSIENGDWRGAGKILANKVNGLFSSIDFISVGNKIGVKINNVLNGVYGFLTNINWQGLGSKIADLLNASIDTVDFSLLGSVLAQKIKIVVDLAMGFISTFDWSNCGLQLSNLINGWFSAIEWSKLGETISNGIKGVLDMGISFIENVDWASIGEDLYNLISSIDLGGIINKLATLAMDALYAGLVAIGGFFNNIWQSIGEEWRNLLELTGGNIFDAFMLGLSEVVVNVGSWLYDNVAKPVIDGFLKIFGINEGCPKFSELGNSVIAGFLQGIVEKVANIFSWVRDNIGKPLVDAVKSFFGIHSPSTVFADIGNFLTEGLLNGISEKWNNLKDKVTNLCSGLVDKFKSIFQIGSPSKVMESIGNDVTAGLENGVGDGNGAFDGLNAISGDTVENMKNAWTGIGDWFRSNVTEPLSVVFKDFGTNLDVIFNDILNTVKTTTILSINMMNIMIDSLETAMDSVVRSVNKIISSINSTSDETGIYLPYARTEKFTRIPMPKLATGTVVPANYGEFAAILGDNKRETEVVSPLSTMKQALVEALQETGGQNITIRFEESSIGDLVRILKPYFERENNRIGSSMRKSTGGAF